MRSILRKASPNDVSPPRAQGLLVSIYSRSRMHVNSACFNDKVKPTRELKTRLNASTRRRALQ